MQPESLCLYPAKKRPRLDNRVSSESLQLCEVGRWTTSRSPCQQHPRSSWFDRDVWLLCARQPDAFDTATDDELSNCVSPIAQRIECLHRQLCQLKRRLGPAAEKAASAHESSPTHHDNEMHDSNDDNSVGGFSTPSLEFERARRLCNPYEVLGEGRQGGLNDLFMNRSAVKLANIDSMIGMSLTHHDTVGAFCFVDLCGAPGGFSEYIMYRCHRKGMQACRGYGMSLQGHNEHGRGVDWNLDHMAWFQGGSCTHHRVCSGEDGTGDIYNWDNVRQLYQDVAYDTANLFDDSDDELGKVHLVLADGGFDAQRDSECQEALAQKLVICQAAAAVTLLRRGGTLVIKMFGFQTLPIRSLMKMLSRLFVSMVVLKPISSRPASAERYVVFAGFEGVRVDFDGLRWRNSAFLGDAHVSTGAPTTTADERRLLTYLDRLDRDLLELNAKACFDILTALKQKSGEGIASSEADRDDNRCTHTIDINAFRREWSLS